MSVIDEQRPFLIGFIVLFSLLSIVRLYFRIVTGDIREGFFNKREGLLLLVARVLLGVPLFAAVALHIFCPHEAPWSYLSLPLWIRKAGLFLGALALYGIFRVHCELGKYFSSTLVIRDGHKLVRTGPYRLVRHPMYTSYLMLFVAAFLISENWVIGLSGTAVIASLMTLRIGREEALLLEHFGEEYEQYRQTTGMFLPTLQQLSFRRETKEQGSFR